MKGHKKQDGTYGPCHAEKRACPLGGEEIHREFSSEQEMQAHNEKVLEASYGSTTSLKKGEKGPQSPSTSPEEKGAASKKGKAPKQAALKALAASEDPQEQMTVALHASPRTLVQVREEVKDFKGYSHEALQTLASRPEVMEDYRLRSMVEGELRSRREEALRGQPIDVKDEASVVAHLRRGSSYLTHLQEEPITPQEAQEISQAYRSYGEGRYGVEDPRGTMLKNSSLPLATRRALLEETAPAHGPSRLKKAYAAGTVQVSEGTALHTPESLRDLPLPYTAQVAQEGKRPEEVAAAAEATFARLPKGAEREAFAQALSDRRWTTRSTPALHKALDEALREEGNVYCKGRVQQAREEHGALIDGAFSKPSLERPKQVASKQNRDYAIPVQRATMRVDMESLRKAGLREGDMASVLQEEGQKRLPGGHQYRVHAVKEDRVVYERQAWDWHRSR